MRSKKALYNILTETILQLVTIVCSFILPKLILDTFGSEYNGIILSITQFLSYISFLTLGISGSARVAIYRSKGDNVKISKVVKATQNYMKKITIIFVIYVIFMMIFYPYIINSSIPNFEISILIIIIGVGTLFEYSFGVTYSALISALQSKYLYNIILIVLKIISTVLSVILIIYSKNIICVKIVGSICLGLGPICLNIIANKKFNLIKNIDPDTTALQQKKDVMAHSLANCVHEYTDIFLLSLFTNVKIISIYSVYNIVLNGVKKIESIFTNGLEGAFGEIWAQGNKKKYSDNFNTFEFLIFSLVSILFTCTAFLIIPFIKIYTSGVKDVNYIVPIFAYLSVLATATVCLRTPYVIAVQSVGKYKETKKYAIFEAMINLFSSFILVFKYGLIGVTIGTLIANLYRTIKYEKYISMNIINRTRFIFFKRIVWLILCFILCLFIKQFISLENINSWITWIIYAGIVFAECFSITYLMGYIFYRNELIKSFTILKNMLKKRKFSK